jgi:hypothetical protein
LPQWTSAGSQCQFADLVVGCDHERLVDTGRGDGGADGAGGESQGEVAPLLGVQHGTEP